MSELISTVSDNALSTPGNIFCETPEYGYTIPIDVAISQVLTRGSAMAKQTANGLYYLLDLTAVDGTQNIVGVLVDDIDTTSAQGEAEIYVQGVFNLTKLPHITNYATSPLLEGVYNSGAIIIQEAEL